MAKPKDGKPANEGKPQGKAKPKEENPERVRESQKKKESQPLSQSLHKSAQLGMVNPGRPEEKPARGRLRASRNMRPYRYGYACDE